MHIPKQEGIFIRAMMRCRIRHALHLKGVVDIKGM
jgi:hypothetical protein